MTTSRRIRLELVPAHQEALGTVAGLVESDADGSAVFGGFYGHAPQRLALLLGDDRRVWVLDVDGEPVGFLDADLIGDAAHLAFFVVASHRGRGIASGAVGRFLGMRVWPDARHVRATTSASNIASRRVLVRTGFVPVGSNDDGEEVWERPAAEPRREGVHRYLRADGRIDRYPAAAAERRALLSWIAAQAIAEDAIADEAGVNALLAPFTDDVAVLRRYLVDEGMLERTASGSRYVRSARG